MDTIIADRRRHQNNVIDVVRFRRRADGKTVLLGLGP